MGVIFNWFISAFVDLATKYWSIIGPTLQRWKIDDTFFMDPVYALRNAILLGLFLKDSIKNQKHVQIIKRSVGIYALFIVINTCFIEGYDLYQTFGTLLDNIFKVVISLYLFRILFLTSHQRRLSKIPYFWIALGFLIIGIFSGLIDGLSSKMFEQTTTLFYQAHIVKDFFIILALICYSVGIYYVPWKTKI